MTHTQMLCVFKQPRRDLCRLPTFPAQSIPGFEILTGKCGELVAQLESSYQALIDFIDWKDLVLKTMTETLNEVAELRVCRQ